MSLIVSTREALLSPRTLFSEGEKYSTREAAILCAAICATTAAVSALYYCTVDLDWLRGRMLEEMAPERRAAAGAFITRSFLTTTGSLSGALRTLIWMTVVAAYFTVVDRARGGDRRLGTWFGFTTLTYVPLVLLLPLGAAVITLAPLRTLPLTALDSTSLASLLNLVAGSKWSGLLAAISLVQLWPVFIQSVGVSIWMRVPLRTAALIAAIPTICCYAVWALVVLAGGR